jgi:membrane protein YqaA with SNARE-associated domain
MLRRLYDWTVEKAESPYALVILAMVAFAESSFFPIPQEALMIPMIVAAPHRAWLIAGVVTLASVVGAMFGYMIGFMFYDTMGVQLLEFYGKADRYDEFRALYDEHGSLAVAIGAITPFPYKVTTIVSGLLQMNFVSFVIVSLLGRGFRFFLIAALLWKFGTPIRAFIERRLGLVTVAFFAILIGGFVALKYAV